MGKHYFTFGQAHVHRVNGKTFDKDCVIEIEAESCVAARQIMVDNFGQKWASQYKELPDMSYYPLGIKTL